MCVWPDGRVFRDVRSFGDGAGLHVHVVADGDVLQMDARLDDAAAADLRRPLDRDERIDDGVIADRNHRVDDDGCRIAERHAFVHQPLDDAALNLALDLCEVGAGVDAEGFDRIAGDDGAYAPAALSQHRDQVGEVVLALRVRVRQIAEIVEKVLAVEDVDAGIHFVDSFLFGRRILRFHDLRHAIRIAHDAAVHRRVVELHREKRQRVL